MNNKTITIDIDLSNYIAVGHNKSIETIQDLEEWLFNNFESNYQYINLVDIKEYYNDFKDIKDYLKKSINITQEELKLFQDELNQDIHSSLADAFDSSYQNEWLNTFIKLLDESIDKTIKDTGIDNLELKHKGSIKDIENYCELKSVKASIDFKEASKLYFEENKDNYYYNEGDENNIEYIKEWLEDVIKDNQSIINTEYIDQYRSLGDYDDYLTYFKEYNEIETMVTKYRQEEKDKINNTKKMLENIMFDIHDIANYNDKYILDKSLHLKIKRQIVALKKVIENN